MSEMREFDSFFSTHVDSVATAPRRMRTQVLQRMKAAKDSLVRYNYLSVALKTCLATSDIDSAQLLIREIEDLPADSLSRTGWPICSPNVSI